MPADTHFVFVSFVIVNQSSTTFLIIFSGQRNVYFPLLVSSLIWLVNWFFTGGCVYQVSASWHSINVLRTTSVCSTQIIVWGERWKWLWFWMRQRSFAQVKFSEIANLDGKYLKL